MFQNTSKTDTKGVSPLRPGQSYTANFTFQRSAQAAERSTRFSFDTQFCQPNQRHVPPGDVMAGEIPQREFEDGISVLTIGIGGSHLGDATTEPEAERIVDEA